MRTNSLLSGLNCASLRGRSLAQSHGLSPSLSYLSRPSSSLGKTPVPCASTRNPSQLFKIGHLLNVKVKQNYFFAFCRLENAAKSKPQNCPPAQEENHLQLQQPKQKQGNVVAGLVRISEFQKAFRSKNEIRLANSSLHQTWQRLKQYSSKVNSVERLQQLFSNKNRFQYASFLKGLKRAEAEATKRQLGFELIWDITKNHLLQAVSLLKSWQVFKLRMTLIQQIQDSEEEASVEMSSPPIIEPLIIPRQWGIPAIKSQSVPVIKQQDFAVPKLNDVLLASEELTAVPKPQGEVGSAQPESQQLVLKTKSIIPQKKISYAKPISLDILKKCKPLAVPPTNDQSIQGTIFSQTCEHMRRMINLKADQLGRVLPDLNDNSGLFKEALLSQASALEQHNSSLLTYKRSTDSFLQYQEGLTDRTNNTSVCLAPDTSKKGRSVAQSATNTIVLRKANSQDLSPLLRIEELLRSMKNSSRNGSSDKKVVKASREFSQEDRTPVRLQTRYQNHHLTTDYASAEKENMCFRLMTEKGPERSQAADPAKMKSTATVKGVVGAKGYRRQKSQAFTARKMKVEIENIISRRSRQLRTIK